MSGPQFIETRMGRQYFDVTLPELVRQLRRLNDLLALGVEQLEKLNKVQQGDLPNPAPRATGGRD